MCQLHWLSFRYTLLEPSTGGSTGDSGGGTCGTGPTLGQSVSTSRKSRSTPRGVPGTDGHEGLCNGRSSSRQYTTNTSRRPWPLFQPPVHRSPTVIGKGSEEGTKGHEPWWLRTRNPSRLHVWLNEKPKRGDGPVLNRQNLEDLVNGEYVDKKSEIFQQR